MIDWKRVQELRSEIGDEGFREVVELFLDEMDEVVLRLSDAPDPLRFEDDMHFLKGGAWTLGFRQMGGLCQIGEKLAAAGKADAVDIEGALRSYRQSKTAFIDGLENGAVDEAASAA